MVEKNTFLPEFSLEEQTLRATLTEAGEHEGVEYAVRGSPARFRWSLVSCDGLFQSKITHFLPEFSLEEQTLRATLTETGEYEIVEYAVRG